MLNAIVDEARSLPSNPRLRVIERRRTKGDWFSPAQPPWPLDNDEPAVVGFVSLKGGYGRSTALTAVAQILGERGCKIAAVDLDLEAPGLSDLLPPTFGELDVGVIDYLLESAVGTDVSITDYGYPSSEPNVDVYQAGAIDDYFLEKLARLDYEALAVPGSSTGALAKLLLDLRESEKRPDMALLDARAGLHDIAGATANGTSHLAVIFGRDRPESWRAISQAIRQLGRARVESGQGQQPILLVFAQAPGVLTDTETRAPAVRRFRDKAHEIFSEEYYAEEESDEIMGLRAVDDDDAPHHPVAIGFDELILHASNMEAMRRRLATPDFVALADTILVRLGRGEPRS